MSVLRNLTGRRMRSLSALAVAGTVAALVAPASSAIAAIVDPTTIGLTHTVGASSAANGASLAGFVQINDDTTGSPRVNCNGTNPSRGGITKFDIFPGATATGTPSNTVLTHNNIPASTSIREVKSSNAYWNTFGRDRGQYTIQPTYYTRTASATTTAFSGTTWTAATAGVACSKPTTQVSGTASATTYNDPTGKMGPAGASCPDPALQSYVTTVVIGIEIPSASCPPLNALGAATAGVPVTVTIDNAADLVLTSSATPSAVAADDPDTAVDETVVPITATLQDHATSLSSATAHPVIAGKPVTVTLDGGTPQNLVTDSTGKISTTVSSSGLAVGIHSVVVSFAEDAAWRGSTVNVPLKVAGKSVTTVTAAADTFTAEPFIAQATVVGATGGAPADGDVAFTYGGVTQNAPVDDTGHAMTMFTATQNPGTYPVTAKYLGNELFNPSTAATPAQVLVKARPTSVVYDGPTTARWGDSISLGATLIDTRAGTPIAGKPINFTVGNQNASAVTDSTGHAVVSNLPATADVGTYPVSATFPSTADVKLLGSTTSTTFKLGFRYYFKPSSTSNGIWLNPATKQFQVKATTAQPGTGITTAPVMISVFLPTKVNYTGLPALPTVPTNLLGIPYLPSLSSVSLPTLPLIPALPNPLSYIPTVPAPATPSAPSTAIPTPAPAPAANSSANNTATNQVNLGSTTVGDLITKISTGAYPTDANVCQVFTGSPCERRLTVLLWVTGQNLVAGVFDLKTGTFVAATNVNAAFEKFAAVGNCISDPTSCLPPIFPTGGTSSPVPGITPPPVALPTVPAVPVPTPTVPALPALPSPLPALPTVPAVPALPNTTSLAATLQTQINNVAAAAGMTPQQIANMVLTTTIPNPTGTASTTTATLQDTINRLAGTAAFAPNNGGILKTPEFNTGNIEHLAVYTRVYGSKTVPKTAPRPIPTVAEGKALLPQYSVATSNYVPTTPLVPGINPLILAPTSTIPTLPSPVPSPLIPDTAKTPIVALHYGGKLLNVQGTGWNVSGADPSKNITSQGGTAGSVGHTAGNSVIGTSLDTAPTPAGSQWPTYLPLLTKSNTLVQDTKIDFLGFGIASVTLSCTDFGQLTIGNNTTYLGMLCLSVNLLLGDGIATFDGSPVNFRKDLAPLWSPAPPPVDVASNAVSAVVGQVGLTSVLGLLSAVPAVPSVPVPSVPSVPTP